MWTSRRPHSPKPRKWAFKSPVRVMDRGSTLQQPIEGQLPLRTPNQRRLGLVRPAPSSREVSERPEDPQSLMNIKQPPVQWYAGELVLHIHIPVPPAPPRNAYLRSARSPTVFRSPRGAGVFVCGPGVSRPARGSRVRGVPTLGRQEGAASWKARQVRGPTLGAPPICRPTGYLELLET